MTKESNSKIKKSETKTKDIVKKRDKPNPRVRKVLKVKRAPKRTRAHDAPSKKFMILSNVAFCIK